ncbi:substrate-binding domain-containing protein [Rubellimicrobium roseum]|uniref:LacI family DNA-binding transcriptional regulator n=1 Tax=Rubellimicrobium roseum TaxID=687525 RepID=A0A5C4NB45_9RHOB|nr:substrate-binding domain-containing protein [Rubellimicrobium roseum]TNC66618.1 LacI family DNA-binding transcriptional regulator [Rubellimicrobium roseum]
MSGIRALARRLELSIGTVSRALNGRPDVNPATRDRVLNAAREMGYRPNQSGRALRHGRTSTVGLVMETGNPSTLGGDSFFMWLVDALQEELAVAGLDLVILPCHSADDPIAFLERQVARRAVDALIISATRRQDARIAYLAGSDTPFVALGRSETPGDYAWIDLDFETVARESVERLAALGHRRIAVAVPQGDANLAHLYLRGYRAAVAALGLPDDPALVLRTSASENGGVEVAQAILAMDPRPTAVMLGHEMMAIGLYSTLERAGLRPGADLSVVGFRQNPQLGFLSPSLACFRLDLGELGRALGRSVVDVLASPAGLKPGRLIWPMGFEPGPSMEPPPL